MDVREVPETLTTERLLICSDPRVGLRAVIAIDDTTLGPGFGGVRMRAYPSLGPALDEAQRLAAAMTLKNALAGIPYGGAKSVILTEPGEVDRVALMHRYGQFVAELSGVYLPGVDMGTSPEDMRLMAEAGADTSCADEDPSPWTARGVFAAISSAVRFRFGAESPAGLRVLVQGVGHVGASLARQLAQAGALVAVSDIDTARAEALAVELGAVSVPPEEVVGYECEVFAPCAIARVASQQTVPLLRCAVIAGAANDTLDDVGTADQLADAGILYVPDFVANSGGVRFVHQARSGGTRADTEASVAQIGDQVSTILTTAHADGSTPLAAAHDLARQVLAQGQRSGAGSRGVPDAHRDVHQIVRNYYATVDSAQPIGVVELFTEDAVYRRPGYQPMRGRQALREFYGGERVIASGRHTITRIFDDGADQVAVEGRFTGQLRDGSQVDLGFADVFILRGSLITERTTYFEAPLV